ncbi:hypothetical protein [Hansschlegelia zhihuaiae]|uniref:Uncharacterized protein n=1 Tax=Hansschlegelia zhihuaiae TaxID=405005 RepID=A0A4Q0M5L7_9HYPH|nr:hypothetical protein [Hansschlegelia zhihuaiae]RXF67946.1 hypothetical protein EK403_20695 [Hansschlegelia zhihuaiae]
MAKTDADFEGELDALNPGTRETLIVAAHKEEAIWNDTMAAHSLDVGSASELRDYILRTYDSAGARLT